MLPKHIALSLFLVSNQCKKVAYDVEPSCLLLLKVWSRLWDNHFSLGGRGRGLLDISNFDILLA
jgi:hypothetical protein